MVIVNKLFVVALAFTLASCFSQSETAIEACKVAFRSSNTVSVAKFDQTGPYTIDKKDRVVVNFSFIDDNVHNTPTYAECEIAAPFESGDFPELLRMHVNGNYFSEDKVTNAQSAIIDWIEQQK